MNDIEKLITTIRNRILTDMSLGKSIDGLNRLAERLGATDIQEQTGRISQNLDMMRHYATKNASDPQRKSIYRQLLRQSYSVLQQLAMRYYTKNVTSMRIAAGQDHLADSDHDSIRRHLEEFVQDMAMLSLESGNQKDERSKTLYTEHYNYLNTLFCHILTTPSFSREDSSFYLQLLTSHIIDQDDQTVICSAIMLSAQVMFDCGKTVTLAKAYTSATDVKIRQHALVALMLCLPQKLTGIFPELQQEIQKIIVNADSCNEILSLQQQVIYCMNAERDKDNIKRNIMPGLMEEQQRQFRRFGIIPQEDNIEEIIHADAEENKMREMEEKIQKIADMSKSGSDIFFGGFSQMKRFSFFYTMSNWFLPFSINHPQLSHVRQNIEHSRFLDNLMKNGPFCDSDKYSFALAMTDVLQRLPENVRELINGNDTVPIIGDDIDKKSPMYIRRMYLQDLFRFYRLCEGRNDMSPKMQEGQADTYLFMKSEYLMSPSMQRQRWKLEEFLLSQKRFDDVDSMTASETDKTDRTLLMTAFSQYHQGNYRKAVSSFKSMTIPPDGNDTKAVGILAKSLFLTGDYDGARKQYQHLLDSDGSNINYAINLSICEMNCGDTSTALNRLFKLDLNDDSNPVVRRALAWGLMMNHQAEKAESIYDNMKKGDMKSEDMLNAGYCKWFLDKTGEAVERFRAFEKLTGKGAFLSKAHEDRLLLEVYQIKNLDIQLMNDMIN